MLIAPTPSFADIVFFSFFLIIQPLVFFISSITVLKFWIMGDRALTYNFLYKHVTILWRMSSISFVALLLFFLSTGDLSFLMLFTDSGLFSRTLALNTIGNLLFFILGWTIFFLNSRGYVFSFALHLISYFIYLVILFIPTFIVARFLYQLINQ